MGRPRPQVHWIVKRTPMRHHVRKTKELLSPLIIDATKGSLLQNTMRDLQVMDTEKLLSYATGFYLETLQEVSANYLPHFTKRDSGTFAVEDVGSRE